MNINQPRVDLNPHAWAEVARILEHHVPELDVWAFGSRAKWTAKSHSDLDLALIGSEPLSLEKLAFLKEAFDESALPFRVDIVDWGSTSESFRKLIERDKVVVQSGKDQVHGVGWKSMALEDCLEALIDYRGKTPEKTLSGIPLVTAKVIKAGRIETPTEYIAAEEYDTWMRRGIPKAGDVVMTTEAPLGEVAQLGREKVALAQRVITLRGKENLLDNTYLLYLLQSDEMQEQLKARATGTTVLGIKQSELRKVTLRIPPITFQRSAAETLKALDDRITLLRETNATLEAVAQALFKSWFVDFDPVRAKMEGRSPEGMDEATARLFPDRFEESELGLVPTGWRFSTVGESFVLTMGQSPPGDTYSADGNGLPFYQGRTDFGFRFPSKRMYCSAPTRIAEIGDTLVSVRAPVGDVNMAIERCCVGRDVSSVRHPKDYRSFTFYAMRGLGAHFENFDSEGTIFGSINKKDFQALPVIAPTLPALAAYDVVSSPIDAKIVENEEQIRTLATLRDTLLPRLISGALRLPEAQSLVEDLA